MKPNYAIRDDFFTKDSRQLSNTSDMTRLSQELFSVKHTESTESISSCPVVKFCPGNEKLKKKPVTSAGTLRPGEACVFCHTCPFLQTLLAQLSY